MAHTFNEALSESVRRYPCLYDKAQKEYSDRDIAKNAWEEIARILNIDGGGEKAKNIFNNSKKVYNSRRRIEFRKVKPFRSINRKLREGEKYVAGTKLFNLAESIHLNSINNDKACDAFPFCFCIFVKRSKLR